MNNWLYRFLRLYWCSHCKRLHHGHCSRCWITSYWDCCCDKPSGRKQRHTAEHFGSNPKIAATSNYTWRIIATMQAGSVPMKRVCAAIVLAIPIAWAATGVADHSGWRWNSFPMCLISPGLPLSLKLSPQSPMGIQPIG